MESSYEGIGINITLRGSVVTIAMTQPQVVDGGDNIQIWRVAANILNKQLCAADKGCISV